MGYMPDIAIHPGKTIAELLDREGMTQKNLCERMGISEKHLSQIINGEASITAVTALLLENALGGSASFWINLEKNYQETKARIAREIYIGEEISLLNNYPYSELAKRGYVQPTNSKNQRVVNLWKFFAVNSLHAIPTTESIAFRMRDSGNLKSEFIAAWLRCGEIEAKKQYLGPYSEGALKESLSTIRQLSIKDPDEYSVELIKILNNIGVAIVFVPHFKGTKVSGAVRWINGSPLIQLSLYYSWADIFWFNLFHEIGHIILHGKKEKFIEFDDNSITHSNDKEIEANRFAGDNLIPPVEYKQFISSRDISLSGIREFANILGIHPGIVAGRLCHDEITDWKYVSSLRSRLKLLND